MAIQKRKIREDDKDRLEPQKVKKITKKILYVEIDDEVTTIYEKLSRLKIKNIYLVIPQRAVIFQSAINLKILKRKADDLNKNIYIITNDDAGFNLAKRIGMEVFDKLEGHEHPSLVSGKFKENEEEKITPLKASVNSLTEDSPSRSSEKKLSISELVKSGRSSIKILPKNLILSGKDKIKKQNKNTNKSTLVLVSPNKKALFTLVSVSLMLLLVISYIALPGATLTLTPKSSVIEVPKNVILADADRNRAELDTHPANIIPSYKVTTEIEKVFTYQSTGKNAEGGQNAKGIITVLNTSPNDWPLVPKTRFQTAEGIVYRIDRSVTIPAGSVDHPGTLDLEVIADPLDSFDQPVGERGNIKAETKFFLPALSAENQKKLYAIGKTDFAGGVTNIIKFISKDDVEGAKAKMESDLKDSGEVELKSVISKKNESQGTNLVLMTGKDLMEFGKVNIQIPPNIENQKLESFDVKGKVVVSGIAYNKDDMMSILKRELQMKKNPEKSLANIDEDSFSYKIVENDKNAQKITITATIQGVEVYELSPKKENGERLVKKIKESIVGKEIQVARDFIQNLPEIEKVEIESWPAWAPTLPSVPDNIKIEIKYPVK